VYSLLPDGDEWTVIEELLDVTFSQSFEDNECVDIEYAEPSASFSDNQTIEAGNFT